MNLILSALLAMLAKIMTAEFIEFAVIKLAEALVKRTDTNYDDEFLAKIKELLNRK